MGTGSFNCPQPTSAHFLSKCPVLQGHDDMEMFSDWKKTDFHVVRGSTWGHTSLFFFFFLSTVALRRAAGSDPGAIKINTHALSSCRVPGRSGRTGGPRPLTSVAQ